MTTRPVCIGMAVLSLGLALMACSRHEAARPAPTASSGGSTRSSPPAPTLLSQVLRPEMLGANVAYLEHLVGPAFRTEDGYKIYRIEGCDVVIAATSGAIDNLGVDGWSDHCSFDIDGFFAQGGSPSTPRMPTFGAMNGSHAGDFSADCLSSCGNAADPEVTFFYSGSHADSFHQLFASAPVREDPLLDGYSKWGAALSAKFGEDYIAEGRYLCGDSLQAVATTALGAGRPRLIRVGDRLQDAAPKCDASSGANATD